MEDLAKIFTIIDEIKKIQNFYMSFYSNVYNDWDNFKNKYLSQTLLDEFPKDFLPEDFINSLSFLGDALKNTFVAKKVQNFSEQSSRSHFQRVKNKEKLNYRLILNIYKYRNQYFHSGIYDRIKLKIIIPCFFEKLLILIESFIFYILNNNEKTYKDFRNEWIDSYNIFLNRLENNHRYSESFTDLLELIHHF